MSCPWWPDGPAGLFASSFNVAAKISDPETAKWAADLDEGTLVKSVTGKVVKDGVFFTIVDAQLEVVRK